MNKFEEQLKVDISEEKQRQAMLNYIDKLAKESRKELDKIAKERGELNGSR